MPERRKLKPGVLTAILALASVGARPCSAYIDPGTAQSFFTAIAPVLGMLAVVVGVMLWPARRLLGALVRSLKSGAGTRKAVIGAVILLVLAGAGVAIALLLSGEKAPPAVAGPGKSVFVLGIDGLDPDVAEKMMAAGELPNFSRLAREGTFARLATEIPPQSPVVWSSIATGCNPGRHGVYDFVHRQYGGYLPEPSMTVFKNPGSLFSKGGFQTTRKAPGFWTFTSRHGVHTCVVRWPVTFPAEEVNGHCISGLGVPDLRGNFGVCYFFTTCVDSEAEKKAQYRAVAVEWDGDEILTELPGPRIKWLAGTRQINARLVVKRTSTGASILIGDSEPVELRVGQWSKWIRFHYPSAMAGKIGGMVRVVLTALDPELRLYVGPIHVDPSEPAMPISHPEDYAAGLARSIGPFSTLGMAEDINGLGDGRFSLRQFLALCDDIEEERARMFRYELEHLPEGNSLLAFVFDTSDRIQHVYLFAGDPKHPAYEEGLAHEFADVIPGWYRRMDRIVGEAMDGLGDGGVLMVVSDHGFKPCRKSVDVNAWLVENGYLTTKDGSATVAPLLRNVDWERTRAYAVGLTSIYLNLKGREPEGIVAPGREAEELCEQIAEGLQQVRDPDNGKCPIGRIYLAREIYHGPNSKLGPDMVVGYEIGYHSSRIMAIGGSTGSIVSGNVRTWSGHHLVCAREVPGIFFCNRRIETPSPRAVDIAPTVLKAFGIARPPEMDGAALF